MLDQRLHTHRADPFDQVETNPVAFVVHNLPQSEILFALQSLEQMDAHQTLDRVDVQDNRGIAGRRISRPSASEHIDVVRAGLDDLHQFAQEAPSSSTTAKPKVHADRSCLGKPGTSAALA